MKRLSLVAVLLMAGVANAQQPILAAPIAGIAVEPVAATVVYIGDRAHLAEDDAVRKTHARLTMQGKHKDLEIAVSRWVVNGSDIEELIGKSHLVSEAEGDLEYRLEVPSSGRWRIEIINFENRRRAVIYQTITVGPKPDPDKPDPPPVPPKPDVPEDEFDNIGQRVATWAAGLPKASAVADCYEKASSRLDSGNIATIQDAANSCANCRVSSLTADELSKWDTFGQKLNADLTGRWPLGRQSFGDYYRAIAIGLRGAK